MALSRSAAVMAAVSTALLGAVACVSPSNGPGVPPLTGTVWELQQIQMNDGTLLSANPPQNYTAEFLADGSLVVRADCNRGRGEFTVTDERMLEVSPIATTRAACPDGSISNQFVQALGNSGSFFFQDGDLFVELAFDSGTMQFSAD